MDPLESKFFDLLLKERESIDEQINHLYTERTEVQEQIKKLCEHTSISYRKISTENSESPTFRWGVAGDIS